MRIPAFSLFALLFAAAAAQANISFVKPMNAAECRQVLRDSLDMYFDADLCQKDGSDEAVLNGRISRAAVAMINNSIINEQYTQCHLSISREEGNALFKTYTDLNPETFCTAANRKRIAKLYPRYRVLLEEVEAAVRQAK